MAGQDKWYFTKEQLQNSPSRKCGIDADKELAYRQQAANLIQDMGQRLHVSQLCINTAIVYMHRFYVFHSFTHFHRNTMAAAALFLAAKMEEQPRKLEHVIKVAHLCLHRDCQHMLDPRSEYYQEQAQDLVFNENVLLQTLGFDVAIDHPHTHVVKTCSLIRASKDLAQTSYFMASNSLHLTTMCLQYKPTVVACFCIHLASKWSNWEIPQSNEGKHWFNYVDKTVTKDLLEHLTTEFLHIFDRCPSRLKKKIMSMPNAQGSPSQLGSSHGSGHPINSPFDKEPKKIIQEEMEKVEIPKHQQGLFGPSTSSSSSSTSSVNKIDHREYRERQRRAAAAAAAAAATVSSGSGGNSSNNVVPPPSGAPVQRPQHRWPHPPRESNHPRDPGGSKERDTSVLLHPNTRDPNMPRENTRESGVPPIREQTNIREMISSRDHNGVRDVNNQREGSRETSGIREMSNNVRELSIQRDRDPPLQRDHISQRDLSNSHSVQPPTDNVMANSSDVRIASVNLRDVSVSGNIRDSSNMKESLVREARDHGNSNNSGMGRDVGVVMREPPLGGSRSISGHSRERDNSNSRGHNGPSTNMSLQRPHPRQIPPQGITPDSRQRSSQPGVTSRPPQVLPASQSHTVPPQRPPSLFSPPEPQPKPPKPTQPAPIQSPLLSIPREALLPAPLSPFSSPNELESKPMPVVIENVVKKEEVLTPLIIQPSAIPPLVEAQVTNNLETDPNLVSSLLKEAIPHRSEKKKKKEKHKHKDKKDKKEKHKKSKDKKRDMEQVSSNPNTSGGSTGLPQPIVSNSSNLSIKITLPREAAASVLPVNPPLPTLSSERSPPARLTIKIPKERIKIDPPSQQALKIKIPKEIVERGNRKRPMVNQGASREGPPSKTSRSQSNTSHQHSSKIPHHAMGNGQSNYHK